MGKVNDILDAIEKAEKLFCSNDSGESDSHDGKAATNSSPSVEVLRIAVTEQRRFHDELTASFRSVRTKIWYLIAATLTVLTFLYAGAAKSAGTPPVSVRDRLFIPDELYGVIFYFAGLAFVLYALAKLLHGARPGATWSVPFESKDYAALAEKDERQYLIKLKSEYLEKTGKNLATHTEKNIALRDAFYPLIIGAIILVVLRYFQ